MVNDQRHSASSRLEASGVLILACGWGWIGGNFSQPNFAIGSQILITGVHLLPCVAVVLLGALLLSPPPRAWARPGLSILSLLSTIALGVIVALGVSNPDPNSFGPHNFADYFPVALLVIGIVVWFTTQWRRHSAHLTSIEASRAS